MKIKIERLEVEVSPEMAAIALGEGLGGEPGDAPLESFRVAALNGLVQMGVKALEHLWGSGRTDELPEASKAAEPDIAAWLRKRGWTVEPPRTEAPGGAEPNDEPAGADSNDLK